jgi:hypothetical protein
MRRTVVSLIALAVILEAAPVHAGTDFDAAPVSGALSSSAPRLLPKQEATLTLDLRFTQPLAQAEVLLVLPPGLKLVSRPARLSQRLANVLADEERKLIWRVRAAKDEVFDVAAEVVTSQSPSHRQGRVFGVTINAAKRIVPPHSTFRDEKGELRRVH